VDTANPPWSKRQLPLTDPANPSHCTHAIDSQGRTAIRIWRPKIPLPVAIQDRLKELAQTYRNERCGFITSNWLVREVQNSHLHPRNNYYFDPDQTEQALRQIYEAWGTTVLGQFHTHPNGVPWPSPRDLVGWPNPLLGWRYWIATPSEVVEWQLGVAGRDCP
jgi:proteasome lid subunit RPN8/RPN11